jgi:3-oxoacyl-[acyl-carrier-protein] synthase-1
VASHEIAIQCTGLVTSVGLSAPASCAAIRAKLTNPSETRFVDSAGEWIMAHEVPLENAWRGLPKLAHMAATAIDECLEGVPRHQWQRIPLLLCVAERGRPGRHQRLDEQLFLDLQSVLQVRFAPESSILAHGRVGTAMALMHARRLIYEREFPWVVIAATDSLLNHAALWHYERNERLLTAGNSNGFMPGEGAGALRVAKPSGAPELRCAGVGFGMEKAHVESDEPLRGDGLTTAIKSALGDAGCGLHELDCRIADISGEQYYFKEAALALGRTLRGIKDEFDIWHPAECIGETGALAGVSLIAVAESACRKAYAPGPNILAHMANDAGERGAAVLRYGVAA